MPKILQNVRQQLMEAARRQVAEQGYANTTIRSVAGACGVGVGTVYNYFPSKDMLIATFMLEDWQACLAHIAALPVGDPETFLQYIYEALLSFAQRHTALFQDIEAAKVFAGVFTQRHKQLRAQLADVIQPHLPAADDTAFLAEFAAESLLSWTMEGENYARLAPILRKIIL